MPATKVTALLPMKAHSERVPEKNFRPLAGKPLFRWILDTLLDVPEIDRVVINTDARDLLAARGLGDSERVVIRDRKPELCGDFVSMNLVLADDVANLPGDMFLMTHVTNPLVSVASISEAVRMFLSASAEDRADSLFSVTKYQTRFYRGDGSAVNHDPKNLIRTQDLEPWFEENSCMYLFSRHSFEASNARIGQRPLFFEMQRTEAIDIDTPEDWQLAEWAALGRGGAR